MVWQLFSYLGKAKPEMLVYCRQVVWHLSYLALSFANWAEETTRDETFLWSSSMGWACLPLSVLLPRPLC